MSLKKLILALTGLGLVVIGFTNINYYIEKNKHNHPVSTVATNNDEEKMAFNPEENTSATQNQNKTAPSLQQNTGLPNEIPPAMLEAMKKQGITIEDLRNGGNKGQNSSMGMGGKMGMNGQQFPEEMLKAIEEQNKQKANAQQNTPNIVVEKAMRHLDSHGDKNEIESYKKEMKIADTDPTNSDNIISLAQRFLKHGEIKAAEFYLQKGIIASPSNPELLDVYGEALIKNLQYEKAAEQWERSLHLKARAETHYNLGMLYRYKLSKEELAKEHFKKAMISESQDKHLLEHLKKELNKQN